ncbi:FMN-binding negative transcriptional regulator [Algiphilus sp. W345]|uniref:FMN-binding negative transcriptional regulator n=1 Tax=Banduia mediterranea TaxID=3075609 RepID=A0ABU2WDJ3_9GAMM|nr:FMN-binding negative transcriptional regulator [Algiphilus sp. W345]MDT0495915.1 FMN-binding negative transcriptional regulator [Algiphilus sp. W345]
MATYIPSAFAGSQDDARRLIDRYPFAVLLTQGKDAPQISHLPLLFEARDGGDVLVGHVAKANPQLEPMASRMPSARRAALLGGIVGFEPAIRQVDVTLKLSQNKSAADRVGVIAGLRGENQEELLSWMLL